jgi:tRNA (guanine-N7-)-methyltransferase
MTQTLLTPTHRRVRSFVRREGRMTQTQANAWKNYWPLYGLEVKMGQPLDLELLFGRFSEKVIEIGFGDGQSLCQMAKNAPEKDFIGIEVYRTGVGNLLELINKENLPNVRVICADALEVMEHQIPDASLAAVQIFFADPWPKTRHHKRRLIQANFVTLVAKKLKSGGLLHLATDWEDYAHHMMHVLSAHDEFQNSVEVGQFPSRPDFRPLTKYEQRGLKLGHKTWDLLFQRKQPPSFSYN